MMSGVGRSAHTLDTRKEEVMSCDTTSSVTHDPPQLSIQVSAIV